MKGRGGGLDPCGPSAWFSTDFQQSVASACGLGPDQCRGVLPHRVRNRGLVEPRDQWDPTVVLLMAIQPAGKLASSPCSG